MGFPFPLRTVLRLRESLERREEQALQKTIHELARTRHEMERLGVEIREAHEARNRALLNPIPAADLHCMLEEARAKSERREAALAALQELEQQRLIRMTNYQAAHRERKKLSDMADRQSEIYEQERQRSAQKTLDDLFAARSQRS